METIRAWRGQLAAVGALTRNEWILLSPLLVGFAAVVLVAASAAVFASRKAAGTETRNARLSFYAGLWLLAGVSSVIACVLWTIKVLISMFDPGTMR